MPIINQANIEALLTIFDKGIEIFAVSGGLELFLGGISLLFLAKGSTAAKLVVLGIAGFIFGIADPGGTVNWIIASIRDAGISESNVAIMCIIVAIVSLILILALLFLPTIVAFKRNKANRKLILLLNVLLGVIPFGWNIALFMSFMDDKQNTQNPS